VNWDFIQELNCIDYPTCAWRSLQPPTPISGRETGVTGANVDVSMINTVDGRNPAPVGMVNVPMFNVIYKVLCIPRGAGFLPSTVVGELFFSEACYAGRRSSQAILDISKSGTQNILYLAS